MWASDGPGSILNKDRYAARWLWDQGKIRDQWPETNPGDNQGTSVRAAAEALVAAGHVPWVDSYADDDFHEREKYTPVLETGIKAFRWVKSVDDAVLAKPPRGQVRCRADPQLVGLGFAAPRLAARRRTRTPHEGGRRDRHPNRPLKPGGLSRLLRPVGPAPDPRSSPALAPGPL